MKGLYSVETEKAVLALLLQNPDLFYVGNLEIDDFYSTNNQKIFELMKDLKSENKNFDYFILAEKLKDNNELFVHLSRINDYQMMVLENNFDEYIKILKDKKTNRNLYFKLLEFKEKIEKNDDIENEDFVIELQNIIDENSKTNTVKFEQQLQEWWLEKVEKQDSNYIPSGISSFDKKFIGFIKGTLNIIACRPSIGKTSFSIQLAYNIVKKGYNVCFFSLEMSSNQIITRLISQITQVPHHIINSGSFIEEYNYKIAETLSAIKELNLMILDKDNLTIGEIEKTATILKKKNNLDVIIIDYLTLLNMPNGEKKTDRIGEITRRLKLLAKKLNIVIILLSQLNRNTETREEKKPHLADLRDSGNIEQDADMVMLLWRKPSNKGLPSEETELIMAKNRDGAIGIINLKFKPNILKFEELNDE